LCFAYFGFILNKTKNRHFFEQYIESILVTFFIFKKNNVTLTIFCFILNKTKNRHFFEQYIESILVPFFVFKKNNATLTIFCFILIKPKIGIFQTLSNNFLFFEWGQK